MRGFAMYAILLCIFMVLQLNGAPVNPQPPLPEVNEGTDPADANFLALEYRKYLEEVIEVLESDEDFKKELDNMEKDGTDASQDGQVAKYLQFANKNTRTKLDELKRLELRRLKDIHKKMIKESAEQIRAGERHPEDIPTVDLEHVDHKNPHSFEMDDLQKLIKKTTDDLTTLDKERRGEFKKYEMNKEHEYREKLAKANEEEAAKLRQEHDEQLQRHKDHPKVNHPGSKKQLEEVWAEEDELDPDNFEPKTFFMLHDIDGDGYLSIPEVEALFQKELDKVYNSSNPDDDMVEREEEMNRMREHVFNEIDKDKDQFVSMEEFLSSTNTDEFNTDEEWDTLENGTEYNSEELDAYEKALKEKEQARLQKSGDAQPPSENQGGVASEKQDGEHPNPPPQ